MTINSRTYWEARFASNDWSSKGGKSQSLHHAQRYVKILEIPRNFTGKICDFGCAEGDAFIVYRRAWPKAPLVGVDFSPTAIAKATSAHGKIADFFCGEIDVVPQSDVIICSHTLEHLEEEQRIIRALLAKCSRLFVIVPFNETPLGKEHLRSYDQNSFSDLGPLRSYVCAAGWQFGIAQALWKVYIKNLFRLFILRPMVRMPRQIVFEFEGFLQNLHSS